MSSRKALTIKREQYLAWTKESAFQSRVTMEQVEQIINEFANLVNLVEAVIVHCLSPPPPLFFLMITFLLGTDLGLETKGLNLGYNHAFETTFDSLDGLQEYLDSPIVNKFAEGFLPIMEQQFVMDYQLS
ncbi:hypothetical protein POTOM_031487 [Populus tomentosa]|uniref:Stress-response A/B barrel domain-containing protein n=1 Tax=Populus tomentosa TaxID=118781 RepID=A0A8X7Z2P6_POPTO|nr:hypothetical protein POTOM_031487 [Populus tomentosa]